MDTSAYRIVESGFKRFVNNFFKKFNFASKTYSESFNNFKQTQTASNASDICRDPSGIKKGEMDIDILDRKIRRLVCKLKKHDINLEVFDHADIEYGSLLGKGGEGEVRRCVVRYNDVPVEAAVKMVLDSSDDTISITLDEIELLCLAKDPIINTTLEVYGVAAVPDKNDPEIGHLVIVTEAGIMNALQLYQQEEVPLAVTFDLWKRLAASLHTMHTRRIIHHDLKPENILVTAINRNRNGQIEKIAFKVIDLGMGKRVFTDKVVTDDILGTNGYHAPEVLFEDSYDFRADVFMLGITFCVMLHSPAFLRSKVKLKALLKEIHNAKQSKLAGRRLYDRVILPTFEDEQNIPGPITDMICAMLEKQTKRTVSLLDVVSTCGEVASMFEKPGRETAFAVLSPYGGNCQDSGIGGGDCSTVTKKRPKRGSAMRTRSSPQSDVSGELCQSKPSAGNQGLGCRELKFILEPWLGHDDLTLRTKRTRGAKERGENKRRTRQCSESSISSTERSMRSGIMTPRRPRTKRLRSCRQDSTSAEIEPVRPLRKRQKLNYSKFFESG